MVDTAAMAPASGQFRAVPRRALPRYPAKKVLTNPSSGRKTAVRNGGTVDRCAAAARKGAPMHIWINGAFEADDHAQHQDDRQKKHNS